MGQTQRIREESHAHREPLVVLMSYVRRRVSVSMTGQLHLIKNDMVDHPDFTLRLGADHRNLPLVRSLAASVAIRADLSVDDVIDFKVAVDEAAQALVRRAAGDAMMTCDLRIENDGLWFRAAAESTSFDVFEPDSLGLEILHCLVECVETDHRTIVHSGGLRELSIEFVKPYPMDLT